MNRSAPMNGPTRAMVLGAGLGQRMRPLTDHIPKPMVRLAGRPLIDHVLTRLSAAGVELVVVNVHYQAAILVQHLHGRSAPQIVISDERSKILDTGGGVAKALSLPEMPLGTAPFWVHNSDSVWIEPDDGQSALAAMSDAWDEQLMDCLLMLAPIDTAIGYDGDGDFELGPDGHLARRHPSQRAPYVFAGVSIMKPDLFKAAPEGAFSLNLLWNRAIESGRLFGICANAVWMHVGDPASLELAERQLADGGRP